MGASNVLRKDDIIRLYESLFAGRRDIYGTYDPVSGRVWQVKEPVTDSVVWSHLRGERPYGIYPLVRDRTRFVVIDIDKENPLIARELVSTARHYCLPFYIERSKRKGFHCWAFFEGTDGVPACKARAVARFLLQEIGEPETEVFPKQDAIDETVSYGNFINAPLFGFLVVQGRTAFVDESGPMTPYPNQWVFLQGVQRITEQQLDEVIELNELMPPGNPAPTLANPTEKERMSTSFGLPPCARRILNEGVGFHQRIACFRVAIQLRKTGLPYDIAAAALQTWALKNQPEDGKQRLTEREIITQTAGAYAKNYQGCGCEEPVIARYCDSNCPIFRKKQIRMAGAAPLATPRENNSRME